MIRAFILVGKSVFTETRLDNLKAPWRFPVKHFLMFERRDQLRLSLIELLQKMEFFLFMQFYNQVYSYRIINHHHNKNWMLIKLIIYI